MRPKLYKGKRVQAKGGLATATGLPVRIAFSSRTSRQTLVGRVHYAEDAELRLRSLTPRRQRSIAYQTVSQPRQTVRPRSVSPSRSITARERRLSGVVNE